MDKGFFGGLFDLNGDGKLDDFERAVDFAAFMDTIEDEETEEPDEDDVFEEDGDTYDE